MNTANLDPIKQQILDLIQHDPDVKYLFLGWVTDQFVPKTDYSKLLDEIKQSREDMREENRKYWEANDKRWEESRKYWTDNEKRWADNEKRWEENNKRWEANDKHWEENNKRWEENDKHFDSVEHEIKELRQDMDKGFKKLTSHIDRLGQRWGTEAEQTFRAGLIGLVQGFFDGTISKWRVYDKEGFVRDYPCEVELDLVMANGHCIVAEIKSSATQGDVTIFNRTARFYALQTGVQPERKVLIVISIDDKVKAVAEELGIEVFTTEDIGAE